MQQKESIEKNYPFSWIMGVPFSRLSLQETVLYLTTRIQQGYTTFLVTANPEIVMYAQKSFAYKEILLGADIIVPDGIGIVYASRIRKQPVAERVAGYDLLHQIMYQADLYNWKVYLLGANEEVNKLAYERLTQAYPNAIPVGRYHGYFTDGSDIEREVIKEIKDVKPDILFTALGFPRQEEWINRHQPILQIPLVMGVGGSLDVISGKVKRAPKIWQSMGLEWLYRLISMPSRWRRMLVLPEFMLKEIIGSLKK